MKKRYGDKVTDERATQFAERLERLGSQVLDEYLSGRIPARKLDGITPDAQGDKASNVRPPARPKNPEVRVAETLVVNLSLRPDSGVVVSAHRPLDPLGKPDITASHIDPGATLKPSGSATKSAPVSDPRLPKFVLETGEPVAPPAWPEKVADVAKIPMKELMYFHADAFALAVAKRRQRLAHEEAERAHEAERAYLEMMRGYLDKPGLKLAVVKLGGSDFLRAVDKALKPLMADASTGEKAARMTPANLAAAKAAVAEVMLYQQGVNPAAEERRQELLRRQKQATEETRTGAAIGRTKKDGGIEI